MTTARREIVLNDRQCLYHCTSRCVRRAFLCGFDRLTGRSFEHRKALILQRIRFLVTVFSIEVLAYAIMDNHQHLLLRTLHTPLSDEEAARRWRMLYPKRRHSNGTPCEPSQGEIAALVSDPSYIQELRSRLGSISWFMKSINEYIARCANREDDCKGRFWEGRFACQRVDTAAAALSCAVYIDLNQIRAGVADTPEESLFTSVWERIEGFGARRMLERVENSAAVETVERLRERSRVDSWLVPIEKTKTQRGFLSVSLEEYLSLVDWTGRELKAGKRGRIPAGLAPLMERLRINPERWVDSAAHYGSWFYRIVGDAAELRSAAKAAGKKWFKGLAAARSLFCAPEAA